MSSPSRVMTVAHSGFCGLPCRSKGAGCHCIIATLSHLRGRSGSIKGGVGLWGLKVGS